LKARSIAQQEDFSPGGLHLKIILTGGAGILLLLIPAIHDLQDFVPLAHMGESPRGLFSLVPGVTFHLNLLKNPFFGHNPLFLPQRTQRSQSRIMTKEITAEDTQKIKNIE